MLVTPGRKLTAVCFYRHSSINPLKCLSTIALASPKAMRFGPRFPLLRNRREGRKVDCRNRVEGRSNDAETGFQRRRNAAQLAHGGASIALRAWLRRHEPPATRAKGRAAGKLALQLYR